MNEKQKNQIVTLRNPSQMDTYAHVTSPRAWLIAVALFLVMAALVFWGFFGRIPQYFETAGVGIDTALPSQISKNWDGWEVDFTSDEKVSLVLCLVDPNLYTSSQLDKKKANVVFRDGVSAQGTTYIEKGAPASQSEIENKLNYWLVDDDWVISTLQPEKNKYWYLVDIILDTDLESHYWGATCDVSIVTHEDAPISFLFQREG